MDLKKLGPFALAALVVALLPFRVNPAGGEKAREATTAPSPATGATAGTAEPDSATEPSPPPSATSERAFRLLAELTGHDLTPASPLLTLPPNTRLEFLVATVPDPLDTTLALDFDLALDGLQRGFAAEDYLLDRFSLPWHEPPAVGAKEYRRQPGVLVFRRVVGGEAKICVVFLVGETPRQGLHAAAFDRAVATIRRLESIYRLDPAKPTPAAKLEILGPYFSGSAESLARALERAAETGATVMTGSATGANLEEPFARLGTGATFERAVPDDNRLLDRTLCALKKRLGLKRGQVALLVEADTGYGASVSSDGLGCELDPLVVRFSGRLSSLRSALGRKLKSEPRTATPSMDFAPEPQTELELDLTAPGRAVDVVGELSPDAADLDDLALANLIRNLAGDGYRFVGLLSTDPMDKLYLGKRLRQLAPDLLLFTFNNSLLYAHPHAAAALDGSLVITSVPLVPEPADGQLGRQQLATETQTGILRATRALVGDSVQQEDRLGEGRKFGWIVAVGGGSFWPIVSVPLDDEKKPRPTPVGVRLTGRAVLVLGFVISLLGFAAAWLHRTAPPRRSREPEARVPVGNDPAWQGRWLLAGGLALLALAAWITLVVALCSIEAIATGEVPLVPLLFAMALVFAVGVALTLRLAARLRGKELHPIAPRALPGGEKQWVPAAVVLLPLAGWLLFHGWTGGQVDPRFFYQRAITVTSGVSPLVSLVFLGLGLFGWFLFQLRRQRVSARHAVPFPQPVLPERNDELAAAARVASTDLAPYLVGAFPTGSNLRFWGALVALLLFVAGVGFSRDVVRPLTETVGYGRCFLLVVILLLVLGTLSWYRFLRLWRELQRTLARVPEGMLVGLERKEVTAVIDWNPMRSFAWTMPKFRMAKIAAEEVERQLPVGELREEVRDAKHAMLAAEAGHDLEAEVEARRRLQAAFERIDSDPGSRDWTAYRAFRFAAYLRYVFEILRNQLLVTVWLGLTALGAVSFYDYHPRYLLTLAVGAALVGLAATTLVAFYQMETNPTLSAVAGVEPTEVKSWRQLFVNVLSYVLVPLLALLASRIPFLGDLFRQIGNPLLQGIGVP